MSKHSFCMCICHIIIHICHIIIHMSHHHTRPYITITHIRPCTTHIRPCMNLLKRTITAALQRPYIVRPFLKRNIAAALHCSDCVCVSRILPRTLRCGYRAFAIRPVSSVYMYIYIYIYIYIYCHQACVHQCFENATSRRPFTAVIMYVCRCSDHACVSQ